MKTIKATITTGILSLFFAFGASAQSDTTIGSDTTAIPKDTVKSETSLNLIQMNDNNDLLAINTQDTTKSKEVREMEKSSEGNVEEVEMESAPEIIVVEESMESNPDSDMKQEDAVIEETIIEEQSATESPE